MDFNLDDLEKQRQEQMDRNRKLAGLGAIGDAFASSQSVGNFALGRMNPESTTGREIADKLSDKTDPLTRYREKLATLQSYKEGQRKDLEDADKGAERDPTSKRNVNYRNSIKTNFPKLAEKLGPQFDQITMQDHDKIFDPLKLREQIDGRNQQAAILAHDRQLQRDMKYADKAAEKEEKKKASMDEVEIRRSNINLALDQLGSMIDKYGTYEMWGSHNQDLDRLVEQVATDMAKLSDPNSVARPSEVEAVKKTLIQSGFQNANSTAKDILSHFNDEVNRRADIAYQIRGVSNPGSAEYAKRPPINKKRPGNNIGTTEAVADDSEGPEGPIVVQRGVTFVWDREKRDYIPVQK